jgi:peptidoglycan/LPS O-acetylase OafA/YrhL
MRDADRSRSDARGPAVDDARAAHIEAIQAGRAAAAAMVALYHANDFVVPGRLLPDAIAWRGFGMGYAGVEFFFVLSGFIIAHVHARDVGKTGCLRRFVEKRLIRIYPIYWIVLLPLIALYQIRADLGPDLVRDPAVILHSLLLLPSEGRPVLPVTWSLEHEMLFYLFAALVILTPRAGGLLFAAWMAGCAAALFLGAQPGVAAFLLSPYNLLFCLGASVAYLGPDRIAPIAPAMLVAGVCGFLAIGMTEEFLAPWRHGARTLAYGVSGTLVVAALAYGRFVVASQLVCVGDASYAIYLVHLPAMNAAAILAATAGVADVAAPIVWVVLLTMWAILVGVALHLLVERPLLRRLSERGRAPAGPRRRDCSGDLA